MDIKTPEEFSQALEFLLNNDTTRGVTLEKLIQIAPTNPHVQIAHQYETNPAFRKWLNDINWKALNENEQNIQDNPCQPTSAPTTYESPPKPI